MSAYEYDGYEDCVRLARSMGWAKDPDNYPDWGDYLDTEGNFDPDLAIEEAMRFIRATEAGGDR